MRYDGSNRPNFKKQAQGYTSKEMRPFLAVFSKAVAAMQSQENPNMENNQEPPPATMENPPKEGKRYATFPGVQPVFIGQFCDTPEKALAIFLRGWLKRDWPAMHAAATRTWRHTRRKTDTAALYEARTLENYGFPVKVTLPGTEEKNTSLQQDIAVECTWFDPAIQKRVVSTLYFRLTRESAAYVPNVGPGSSWGVNPPSGLREAKDPAPVLTDATEAQVGL